MNIITPDRNVRFDDVSDGIIIIVDHMPHYDFEIEFDLETDSIYQHKFHNTVSEVIQNNSCDYSCIFSTHYLKWDYNDAGIPCWFLAEAKNFRDAIVPNHEYTENISVFNMMNKIRDNRILVSSWFHHNGEGINYDYTQSWDKNSSKRLRVIDLVRNSKYDYMDTMLEEKFIESTEVDHSKIFPSVFYSIFRNTKVSVVTEPNFWESGCSITEKYLYSLYGLCFPVFCGSYGLPDALKEIGFDVFDDVINHEYQWEENPVTRTLRALDDNKNQMQSASLNKKDYMKRHLRNLSLVREELETLIENTKEYGGFNRLSEVTQTKIASQVNRLYGNKLI